MLMCLALVMAAAPGPQTELFLVGGLGAVNRWGYSVQAGLEYRAAHVEVSAWARYRAETFYDLFPQYRGAQAAVTARARLEWLSVGLAADAWEEYPVFVLDAANGKRQLQNPGAVRLGFGPSVSATTFETTTTRLRLTVSWLPLGTRLSPAHLLADLEFTWRFLMARVSVGPREWPVIEAGARLVF